MISAIFLIMAVIGIGIILFYGLSFVLGLLAMPFVAVYNLLIAKDEEDRRQARRLVISIVFFILSTSLLTFVITYNP